MNVVALKRRIIHTNIEEKLQLSTLYFLRGTAEYLVTSADTRPNLVILRFGVTRSVKVGLNNKF